MGIYAIWVRELTDASRKRGFPGTGANRLLLAAWCGCGEPNLDLLEEQRAF